MSVPRLLITVSAKQTNRESTKADTKLNRYSLHSLDSFTTLFFGNGNWTSHSRNASWLFFTFWSIASLEPQAWKNYMPAETFKFWVSDDDRQPHETSSRHHKSISIERYPEPASPYPASVHHFQIQNPSFMTQIQNLNRHTSQSAICIAKIANLIQMGNCTICPQKLNRWQKPNAIKSVSARLVTKMFWANFFCPFSNTNYEY